MFFETRFTKNKWIREILIFLFLILVTFLNDRADFSHEHAWIDGFFVFMMLYLHLQVHRFFILPFLDRDQYFFYSILTLLCVLIFTTIALAMDYYLTDVGWFDDLSEHKMYLAKFYLSSFSITVPLVITIHSIFKQYTDRLKKEEERYLLHDMELKLLKAQSNPHFLFNAINSLYGLSLEKPHELPDKILQMSAILRYQIDISRQELISVEEELRFLKQYINFEKDRLRENVCVNERFDLSQADLKCRIPSMILIFFVENAFKHVVKRNDEAFVDISIAIIDEVLTMTVGNSFDPLLVNHNSLHLGLNNVKRRLRLLYSSDFDLDLTFDLVCFRVLLSFRLI